MKTRIFRLVKKNTKPSLEGAYFPKERGIPASDVIYIAPTGGETYGKNVAIRYARGEKEIEVDRQSGNAKKGEITFKRGFFFLNPRNTTLAKFFDTTNHNLSNPNRDPKAEAIFFEIKPGEQTRGIMKNKSRLAETIMMINNMKAQDARELCEIMGYNVVDVDPDDLRYMLTMRAEQALEGFLRILNSDALAQKKLIARALRLGVLSREGSMIKLQPSGRIVTSLRTQDPIAELYDFFCTNEGKELLRIVKSLVDTKENPSEKEVFEEALDSSSTETTAEFENMTLPELFTQMQTLDPSVQPIVHKMPYYWYGETQIGKSKKSVYEFMEENPTVVKKIKALLLINRPD